MRSSEHIAAVIPCLNEAETIGALVREVRKFIDVIYVVDDGSRDGTTSVAINAGARVIIHSQPRGKGAALRQGLAQALQDGFYWAVLMDGDGQHAPQDIPAFLQALRTSESALVVGNRLEAPAGMPLLRYWVNRVMSLILSGIAGVRFPDSQCGFRLVKLNAWRSVSLRANHFQVESEMLLAFAAAELPISFVPIQVQYRDERSKINPIIDTVRWLAWLAKWLLRPARSTEPLTEKGYAGIS